MNNYNNIYYEGLNVKFIYFYIIDGYVKSDKYSNQIFRFK